MFSRRSGIIVTIVGVVLVILGAVWMTVFFPSQEKIPTDYERTLYFEGTQNVTREQVATGTVDNVLLIDEQITATDPTTGQVLSSELNKLAVDRSTRQMVPDYGDIPREGYWSPPSHLKQGGNFKLWNPKVNEPVETSYMGKEEFRGLTVFKYEVNKTGVPIIPPAQQTGFDRLDSQITLWVEPESGVTVDQRSVTTYYITYLLGENPAFISDVKFTDGTIADLVDTAQSARTQLLWFGIYIPWIVIGLGGILTVVGVVTIVRRSMALPSSSATFK